MSKHSSGIRFENIANTWDWRRIIYPPIHPSHQPPSPNDEYYCRASLTPTSAIINRRTSIFLPQPAAIDARRNRSRKRIITYCVHVLPKSPPSSPVFKGGLDAANNAVHHGRWSIVARARCDTKAMKKNKLLLYVAFNQFQPLSTTKDSATSDRRTEEDQGWSDLRYSTIHNEKGVEST